MCNSTISSAVSTSRPIAIEDVPSGSSHALLCAQVSKSCINSIANSNSFGGIYQEIFRACKVSVR
jgi:hypothetical protein